MSDAPTPSEILDVFNVVVNARYATCVATALIAYDYVLTLDLEINHIWSQPFSGATILYLMNRYGYPLQLALELVLISDIIPLNDKICNGVGKATDTTTVGIVAVAGLTIFTLRTWAIYLKNWKVLAFVGLFAIAKISMDIAIVSSVASYEYVFQITCGGNVPDVYYRYNDNFLPHAKANDYLLLTFDTVVFVLTFYKTFRSAAHMKKLGMTNSLTFWLLRDGFIYYFGRILLVVFDILSFSFPQFFQYDYSLEILNAVGNILINHLLLNLRHVSARQSGGGFSQNTLPEVAFASNATIGNIGAPLTEDPEEFTWALERSTEKRNDAPDMIEAESSSTLQEV